MAVAKLDRIARDAELVRRLSREAERNGMAGFLFCDLPDAPAWAALTGSESLMAESAAILPRVQSAAPSQESSIAFARAS